MMEGISNVANTLIIVGCCSTAVATHGQGLPALIHTIPCSAVVWFTLQCWRWFGKTCWIEEWWLEPGDQLSPLKMKSELRCQQRCEEGLNGRWGAVDINEIWVYYYMNENVYEKSLYQFFHNRGAAKAKWIEAPTPTLFALFCGKIISTSGCIQPSCPIVLHLSQVGCSQYWRLKGRCILW